MGRISYIPGKNLKLLGYLTKKNRKLVLFLLQEDGKQTLIVEKINRDNEYEIENEL